eukprot:12887048-Prorocentrum_lima.AAC.1
MWRRQQTSRQVSPAMNAKPTAAALSSCRSWEWTARSSRTGKARSGAGASLARWERVRTGAQARASGSPSIPPAPL